MQAGGTTDPEAHNDYLRGMYFLNLGSREDSLRKAVASFEKALARDPDYAEAWIRLGGIWAWIMANGWVEIDEARRHIERAGERARTLAPNLAGGYFLQSTLLAFVDLNWAEALSMAERALALEPGNSEVLRATPTSPTSSAATMRPSTRPSRRSRSIRASRTTGSNSVSIISGRGAIRRRRRCSAS